MRKNILTLAFLGLSSLLFAQFTVNVEMPAGFQTDHAYLYSYNGSQEMIVANGEKSGNHWIFKVSDPYSGLMRVYFSSGNESFMLVSENQDVQAKATSVQEGKISDVIFQDKVNQAFESYQNSSVKKEQILPILLQMQSFYEPTSEFGTAMSKEISRLQSSQKSDFSAYPFINFYSGALQDYVSGKENLTKEDYIKFISNAPQYLEGSAQIRPVLLNYLRLTNESQYSQNIDDMLNVIDVESPRGQVILSEFIDIFDLYGLKDLNAKYLEQAKNLTCTISDRLESTIQNSERVAIGATMQNYNFIDPLHTTAKSIYDVKSNKKLIMFWASTCSHCEAELPHIIENYQYLKSIGVEVIGLSVDEDKASYLNRANSLPWINDSELKGWNSSVSEKYNVHATPSYFILDANNKIVAKPHNFAAALAYFKSNE